MEELMEIVHQIENLIIYYLIIIFFLIGIVLNFIIWNLNYEVDNKKRTKLNFISIFLLPYFLGLKELYEYFKKLK